MSKLEEKTIHNMFTWLLLKFRFDELEGAFKKVDS